MDRAYSAYSQLLRNGAERVSFEEGLELETERISRQWSSMYHYFHQGLYFRQVTRLKSALLAKPVMNPSTRRSLQQRYRTAVQRLQYLLGCDLSGWLK